MSPPEHNAIKPTYKSADKGNTFIISKSVGYIIRDPHETIAQYAASLASQRTAITRRGGGYELEIWVPKSATQKPPRSVGRRSAETPPKKVWKPKEQSQGQAPDPSPMELDVMDEQVWQAVVSQAQQKRHKKEVKASAVEGREAPPADR